jgi:hypothetical protein
MLIGVEYVRTVSHIYMSVRKVSPLSPMESDPH